MPRSYSHFDGHIAQDQGERLVVYFGYPQAHEDNARRAMHTGLGIVERMAELNSRRTRDRGKQLGVQVGIHTGVVVVGARGQDKREAFTLGNTPIIAPQVQYLAAPDTVAISPTTGAQSRGISTRGHWAPNMFEEPAEPLAVYQIPRGTPRACPRARSQKGSLPSWAESRNPTAPRALGAGERRMGAGGLASGEAGIGKSRLVQALQNT